MGVEDEKGEKVVVQWAMLLRMGDVVENGQAACLLVGTVSELEVAGCDDKRGSPRGGQDGDEFLGRWTLIVGPDPEGLGQAGWMDQAERLTDSKGSISYPPLFINHSSMHVVGDDHRGNGK